MIAQDETADLQVLGVGKAVMCLLEAEVEGKRMVNPRVVIGPIWLIINIAIQNSHLQTNGQTSPECPHVQTNQTANCTELT